MTAERQCERVFSTENYNLYFIELAQNNHPKDRIMFLEQFWARNSPK